MLLSVVLATISVAATVNVKSSDSPDNDISPAGCYALYVAFILLFYTVIPLPLYAIVLVSVSAHALWGGAGSGIWMRC